MMKLVYFELEVHAKEWLKRINKEKEFIDDKKKELKNQIIDAIRPKGKEKL